MSTQPTTSTVAAPARPAAGVAAALAGVLLVGAGVFFGVVAGAMLDVMRRSFLVSDDSAAAATAELSVVPMPIAILVGFGAFWLYHKLNRAATGHTTGYAVAPPWALLLLGVAAGIWWSVLMQWAPAEQVGETRNVGGEHLVWPWQIWLLHSLQYWLAPLLTVLAVVAFIAGRVGNSRGAARREVAAGLLAAGHRVPGVVVAGDPEPTPGQGVYFADWQVDWTDRAGVAHRLVRAETFPHNRLPVPGQHVWVVYDPEAPDDAERTFVSIDDTDNVEAYLRRVFEA